MSALSKIAAFGEELKNGVELAGKDAEKAAAWLVKNGPLIESLTAIASPAAATIEQNMFALYQKLADTASEAGAAAAANGISVTLDAATAKMLQDDAAAIKSLKL